MTVSVSYQFDEFVSQHLADAVVAAKTIRDAPIKTVTLSRIALHYARFGQQNQALEVLSQALNPAQKIKEAVSLVKAMGEVAGICLFEPALTNQIWEILTQALQVAQTIHNSEQKHQALSEIAFRYASAGESDRAMRVLDLVGKSSDKNYAKKYFQQSLIYYYITFRKHDEALKLISEAETIDPSEKLIILSGMALDYADLEQVELADSTLTEASQIAIILNNSSEKVFHCIDIAERYSLIGYHNKAIQILKQGLDIIPNIEEENTENISYMLGNIAQGFAQAGQPDYALRVAQTIKDNDPALYSKVNALEEVAGAYVKAGQIDRAKATLFEAFEVANAMPNAGERQAYLLIKLAEKYVKYSYVDRVAEVLAQALNITKDLKPSKQTDELKSSIVFCYKEAGLYDLALQLAIGIKDSNSRNKALDYLVTSYIDTGKYENALRLLEMIDDAMYRCKALSKIAAKYTKSGQIKQGLETFKQAVQIAKNIKNTRQRKVGLIEVFRCYMEIYEYNDIVEIVEIVKTIKDASLEAEVLTRIIYFYNQSGQETKAVYLYPQVVTPIERMRDSPAKTNLMAGIYSGYAKAGQYEQALELVKRIKNAETKVQALLDIVYIYAAANRD
ncbi:tetratricopeptide repeat protein [Argonema antarcticum]|uniref:tetratricopeptide repeat protein n=1 Tax=Argonema antarcticum TaxID=2942763 RepID=UPI002010E65A|nr:hypothetical protein [Argonema antarcticum]MCL1469462.1 hypothetical protein [Argonema antarcticum A004/B2]